jgi:hypothetical protein
MENFEFNKPERITPERVVVVLQQWEQLLADLGVDIDLSKTDETSLLSADIASEKEVAVFLDSMLREIERIDTEYRKAEYVFAHGPLHAYIDKARKINVAKEGA